MSRPHNTTYCLVKQVENFLPELGTLSESTTPKKSQVEMYIQQAEDQIDRDTLYAWRSRRYKMEESFPEVAFTALRAHGYSLWFDGIILTIQYRNMKDLDAAKGDKLEVRIGGSYVDYLATKTEGLNKDYFVINERSKLHIYRRWAVQIVDKVKLVCRYGDEAEVDMSGTHDVNVTTINVDSTDGFPTSGVLYANNGTATEAMYYNGISATTFTNVSRAQQGTTALVFAADDTVWAVPGDIQKACELQACIVLAQNDGAVVNESLGPGRDYIDFNTRSEQWQTQYDRIMERRREVVRI